MKKTLNAKAFPLLTVCVMLLLPVFCACTSSTDLETQVSGKWQRTQGDGIVDINLSATPKTVVLDGQSYTAEIEGVDKGTYTVKVKVQRHRVTPRYGLSARNGMTTGRHSSWPSGTMEPPRRWVPAGKS